VLVSRMTIGCRPMNSDHARYIDPIRWAPLQCPAPK